MFAIILSRRNQAMKIKTYIGRVIGNLDEFTFI